MKEKIFNWLGCKNEMYSTMLEEDITNRHVILYNVAVVVFLCGVLTAEQHPFVGLSAIAVAALLVKEL
ncbi:MAG: hypothetical protein HXN76_01665 [Prevotella pallens]|uniref:hypothetical protein n=1 Tax=Prevotella pallens TaxID=60133 RepID=UPI001CB06D5D|nr:hypothetical protein [Prevotella pallens]MBF1491416.1 hypothetical protein [Prevotella pallens]